MTKYKKIALVIDVFHIIVAIFWVGGFFISKEIHPEFRHFHAIFGITVFAMQLLFSMRCPLTLLAAYFEELANPGFVGNKYVYNPFIITVLREYFGLSIPAILIVIITVIGTGFMVITILN